MQYTQTLIGKNVQFFHFNEGKRSRPVQVGAVYAAEEATFHYDTGNEKRCSHMYDFRQRDNLPFICLYIIYNLKVWRRQLTARRLAADTSN